MSKRKKFERGWSGGWSQYRYGTKSPISLAPVYRGEARKHLINQVIDAVRDWRMTPFEMEAPIRHGLRQKMCLNGFGWTRSDFEAGAIVGEALHVVGAKRPTWEQGQPEYVIPRENCRWCAAPLDEYRMRARFCSVDCAKAFAMRRDYETYADDDRLRRAAFSLIRYTKTAERTCQRCGATFHPISNTAAQRFCSKPCMYAFRGDEAAAVHQFNCEWCGRGFVAKTIRAKFCQPVCQLAMSRMRAGKNMPKCISPPVFDYVFRIAA